MAKRLTDTDKWKDDWYISLSNDYRIIWQWLLDNCNHAGICKRSIALLNRDCNVAITEDDLLGVMEDRVVPSGNNWFIPKFLRFQYPNLTSNKPVIVSVVKEILKNNLEAMIPESFGNDYIIIKDKDKDKDSISLGSETKKGKKPKQDPPGDPGTALKSVDVLAAEALKDTVYFIPAALKQLQNTKHYTPQQIGKVQANISGIMDDFVLHLKSEETHSKDAQGFRSHFKNWLCKRPLDELLGPGLSNVVRYRVKETGGESSMPLDQWNNLTSLGRANGLQRIA